MFAKYGVTTAFYVEKIHQCLRLRGRKARVGKTSVRVSPKAT